VVPADGARRPLETIEAEAIDTQARAAGLTDNQRHNADAAIDDLRGKAAYLRYDLARDHQRVHHNSYQLTA
jgi:hypothetical protein